MIGVIYVASTRSWKLGQAETPEQSIPSWVQLPALPPVESSVECSGNKHGERASSRLSRHESQFSQSIRQAHEAVL